MEHNGETTWLTETQLSRNVEDVSRSDVASYGSQHVAGKPSLCEEQSVQLAADDLVVQQRGLVDGERQLKRRYLHTRSADRWCAWQ